MSPRKGHSTRLGVAVSLLLHGAALLLYLAFAPSPVAPPLEWPLFIELIGPTATAPPAPSPTPPPPSSHPTPTVPFPSEGPSAGFPVAPSEGPSSAQTEARSEPQAGALLNAPRAWFEANGLGAGPSTATPSGAPDLVARPGPANGSGGTDGRPGFGPSQVGVAAADASPGAAARVGTVLRQASGQVRVRASHDPAWSPLSEKLRAHFQPDWSLLEEGPQPKGLAATGLARMLPGYFKMAARFANSERLSDVDGVMGERTSEAGKVADRLVAAGSQSSTGLLLPVDRFENPFQRTYVTLVEVAHGEDGSVAGIHVRQASGNGAIDRLALGATRRSVTESDPQAWAGRARTSVWSFTATFGVLPPAPALACPIEVAWTGRLDRCAYPLKKTSEGRVELQALEE
jgi:hypothetical protein